jgi:FdhD protein
MAAEGATKDIQLLAVRGADEARRGDVVAVEEPLEIRVQGPEQPEARVAVTMRTPGHDEELAVGFLFTEGLLRGPGDLARPATRGLPVAGGQGNVVTVRLSRAFDATSLQRNFYATSSCGICGKAALEHVETGAAPLSGGPLLRREVLRTLPDALRRAQAVFERTGGLHATGLFTSEGELLLVREDVGRHNAIDKLIGRRVLDGAVPLDAQVGMVSGRLSFEIVQKAAMAGLTVLCAVSAPSSLAVQLADRLGMTIVGFLRGEGFNVYAHPHRIGARAG